MGYIIKTVYKKDSIIYIDHMHCTLLSSESLAVLKLDPLTKAVYSLKVQVGPARRVWKLRV